MTEFLEFLKAALPWVLIGLALALYVAAMARQAQMRKSGTKFTENRISEGVCFGLCVGIAMGTSDVLDLPLAIGIGALLGELIGMCIKKPVEGEGRSSL